MPRDENQQPLRGHLDPGEMTEGSCSQAKAESPMTFGIELEFILWYMHADEGQDLAGLRKANPGVVVVPAGETRSPAYIRAVVIDRLRREGNVDINTESFFPVDGPEPPEPRGPGEQHRNAGNTRQARYFRWTLRPDPSVGDRRQEPLVRGDARLLRGLGLELISPALRPTPAAYQEIRHVVGVFRARFAYTVNGTAGLHVHVGRGRDAFAPLQLRRAAALAWLTEDLLLRLHPGRAHNEHAPRLRTHSNLARGMTADAAADAGSCLFGRAPRGPPRCGLAAGLRELLKCPSAGAVAKLTEVPGGRAMVNFRHYAVAHDRCRQLDERAPPTTVEFRAAGGTMNPDWAIVWSSICVGLCEAAGDIDDADLVGLEQWLATARARGTYDVPHLLAKIGGFEHEAQWLRDHPDPAMRTIGTVAPYELLTQRAFSAKQMGHGRERG